MLAGLVADGGDTFGIRTFACVRLAKWTFGIKTFDLFFSNINNRLFFELQYLNSNIIDTKLIAFNQLFF